MARSIWKGDISFGLVSIPISLVSTEENNEIHFHLLNSKTNARVRYQRVDEETGKEVPWNEIVKGYEYDKGNYIIVNEEEFEKASPELFKTIDIEEFVDSKEIDSLYYTKPYYLIPEGKNKKAYVLLREALKKTNKVGIAKTILRTKEYLSIILPHDHTLLLYLIHFKEDLRSEEELNVPKENIKNYKISDKEVKMAVDLINDMSTSWEPEKYHNEYRETMQKWLDKQIKSLSQKGKKVTKPTRSHDAVVDFVSLLKESMKKKKSDKSPVLKKSAKK
ncbi:MULTISPECIES: Ku protein [Legionella]|uniref:Non-homologous end joining protein Ku n=1 Tax=Legionella resiliens TaxID=2905958 RepID=A0ABS8X441_9GAMM|nr:MULTISPECIES: Ku protein [unclassified Legionella]MCE0723199.1 Ku protein [Legionella sp. 9fVS26]MCE3532352.1 Ku protein [Legionella sp. 8cVS16]QLZ68492.1 Ku protein [Legionella sp. PC1000]